MKKERSKFVLGIITGGLIFGMVGVAAANILSSAITFDVNPNSLVGASTVSEALDELYDMAGPVYRGYNDSEYSSYAQNVSSLTSSYNLFLKHTFKGINTTNPIKTEVCIYKNNELGCFKPEYTEAEKAKLQTFFSEGTCEVKNDGAEYYECTSNAFSCRVHSYGYVMCNSGSLICDVNPGGSFGCGGGGVEQ